MAHIDGFDPDTIPADWPEALRRDLEVGLRNGGVGHELLSETEHFRVWKIDLASGERIGFHRHQLDYFWISLTAGQAIVRHSTGELRRTEYSPGMTRHFQFGQGDYFVHDLQNTGDEALRFITVESKGGANPALPLDGGDQ